MKRTKAKPLPGANEPTRRAFFAGAAGGAVALLSGCASSSSQAPASGGATSSGGATGSGGASAGGGGTGSVSCTVYPAQTAGPFYLDLDLLRGDVTEAKPGTPLTLRITVQRAADCALLKDVPVDIWHCDAGGIYSGYPGQLGGLDTTGQKFLRGTQVTDANGRVEFTTIYPGWYPGRTTHIHFKVHPSKTTEAVSQLYFPEDTSSEVYKSGAYAAHGQKDTSNNGDGVVAGKLPPLLVLEKTASGWSAALTVSVAS